VAAQDGIVQNVGTASIRVVPELGGRLASLVVHGRELLLQGDATTAAMTWGSFPMVPWAGRIRRGRFDFDGETHTLVANLGLHAIHGTGFERSWIAAENGSIAVDLQPGWPFRGHAVQRFDLSEQRLVCTLELHADEPMPGTVGWHPWFVKPDELEFHAGSMFVRDDDGLPTGALVAPSAGPWDDCFTDVAGPVTLRWDDVVVELTSSCDHWVIFDEPPDATCVEPQSGPPDGVTLCPEVVLPDHPLVHTMTIAWSAGRMSPTGR
jgi:aldose 1-epimerase